MKSVLSLLLALLLLLPCSLPGSGASAESAEVEEAVLTEEALIVRPLPVDFTGGLEPQESGYGEMTYEDPTIKVSITYKDTASYVHGHKNPTAGAWIVDVHIGHASQLRTAAAESFSTETTQPVSTMAERVKAVVAFNGDFVTRLNEGFIVRQGINYRDKLKGRRDVLIIDEDGDFHPFHLPKKGELSDTVNGKKIINAFYFGPILVENGEVPKKLPDFQYLRPDELFARIALCQVGPLHYKVIVTTSKQNNETFGLKLKDFAQLCKDEGAQIAYNLDGGMSTTLFFHHDRVNQMKKINFRDVPDIFYFASAWNGEEAP